MDIKLTITDAKVTIGALSCEIGQIPETTIDLSSHAGKRARIWLDKDGTYSTDPSSRHYWQVAELDVPYQSYTSVGTGKVDKDGEAITESVKDTLTLSKIRVWDVEKIAAPVEYDTSEFAVKEVEK